MNNGLFPTPQRTLPPSQVNPTVLRDVTVRQTVMAGPIDSGGLPSFLPTTTATLSIATQNITELVPLIVTAAQGFDYLMGGGDIVGFCKQSLSWNNLVASQTNYLYVDIAPDGSLIPGSGLLAPVYQWGGTRSVTAGQFTFNIQEMYGTVGDGAQAARSRRVYVGEAVTSGSAVTSTVAYAYQGRYQSPSTALPSAGGTTTLNHNLGVQPLTTKVWLINVTTEGGYVPGDTTDQAATTEGSIYLPFTLANLTKKTAVLARGSSTFAVRNITTQAFVTATPANWNIAAYVARGW